MNWKKLLHLDLVGLLFGHVEVHQPAPRLGFLFRLRPRIRSVVTGRSGDLSRITFNLSQAVACNAPLVPAIDAMMGDDIPTYRMFRVLCRLRDAMRAGMTLSEAMRRQPNFFPRYYADLVEAGERSGTLLSALQEAGEVAQHQRSVGIGVRGAMFYVVIITFVAGLFATFLGAKVVPVFLEIHHDFASELKVPDQQVQFYGWFGGLIRHTQETIRNSSWTGLEWGLVLISVFVAFLYVLRLLRNMDALLRVLRMVPGLGRVFLRARCALAAGILGRLLKAGYPLDEALDSIAVNASPRRWRGQLARMRDAIRSGRSFHEAVAAEGHLLPSSLHDLVFVGETTGRLPGVLEEGAHLYREQVARISHVLGRIGFCLSIVGLGCVVYQVYAGTFMLYISIINRLFDSL